jgi:uncharacterized protein with HEPN domain
MSNEFRDTDYLEHIQTAIKKILRYLESIDEGEFRADELLQDAVIRNLEIIGEAVSKLSAALKANYLDVPWTEISGMRNRLIHGYISVNLQIVWDTVQEILPKFSGRIQQIQIALSSIDHQSSKRRDR